MNTELLKLKHTLIWPVVLLVPLLTELLTWAANRRSPQLSWSTYLNNGLSTWAVLMLPLVLALIIAQVAAVEHTAGGWRLALTLPRPRWVLFGRKFATLLLLTLLLNVLFVALLLLGALALPHLSGPLHLWPLLLSLAGLWISTLAMTAILYVLALRSPSFLAPSGLGVAAAVVGLMVAGSQYGRWWPWSLGGLSLIRPGSLFWTPLQLQLMVYSMVVALAALALGLLDFSRRDR